MISHFTQTVINDTLEKSLISSLLTKLDFKKFVPEKGVGVYNTITVNCVEAYMYIGLSNGVV